MISVAKALSLIVNNRPAREETTLPLVDSAGHTLAADVIAKVSKPPAPVSAMDGYAVRLADVLAEKASLKVIAEAPAGAPCPESVSAGEAVRIFTGATLPKGADHVVIQENVKRDGDTIVCQHAYDEIEHVRPTGIDFEQGALVLMKGTRLSALDLALVAAANHGSLAVYQPLKVALLSNGDELKLPGSTLQPGEIISANPFGIGALLKKWGAHPVDLGIAKDSLESIEQMISATPPDFKIIVTIGGASVGDHDYVRQAFLNAGFEMIFEKVAVRPGKPTWFAKRSDQLVLGLPGNPASALVCAHLFLRPLVETGQLQQTVSARTTTPIRKNGPRESYLRAKTELHPNGILSVRPMPNQDSSLLTPLADADCLIRRLPNQSAAKVGALVDILLIQPPSW